MSESLELIFRMLQWGRDLLIAEMRRGGQGKAQDHELQWGRDLLIAEIAASLSYSVFKHLWPPLRPPPPIQPLKLPLHAGYRH